MRDQRDREVADNEGSCQSFKELSSYSQIDGTTSDFGEEYNKLTLATVQYA